MDYISRPGIERIVRAMLGRPAVISISGPVGVGKTSLLGRFEGIVKKRGAAQVAYINFRDCLAQAIDAFPLNETSPQSFQEETACYIIEASADHLDARSTLGLVHRRSTLGIEAASNAEILRLLASAGDQTFPMMSKALMEGLTPLPVLARLLRVTGETTVDGDLVDSFLDLATRNKRERDRKLLLTPHIIMTDTFVEELLSGEKDKLVFLLDDVNPDLDTLANWLRNLMKRLAADLQTTWVLASWRKIPEDDWRFLPDLDFLPVEVPRLKVNLLQEQLVNNAWRTLRHFPSPSFEVGTPYTALGPVAEKHTLIESTRETGEELSFLPLLVSEAVAQPTSDQACCESLTSSFREWLTDDGLFEHIRRLAVTRWFDKEIVKRSLRPTNDVEIWERLLSVGEGRFIEQRGVKRYLQPDIRYALLRYTQTHYSMEDYYALHRPLMALYRDRIASRRSISSENSVSRHRSYDRGIRRLLAELDMNSRSYRDVLNYQQRLNENLNRSNQYGHTPERRSDRSEILDHLNSLSLSIRGVPFEELCFASDFDEHWLRKLEPGTLLSHPPSRSDYVEWCYHAFSAHANPSPVLLDVLQRALMSGFADREVGPLISAIYQVADERHAEPDFLTSSICLLNLPIMEVGRQGGKPKSYEKRFRVWGENLEECLHEFRKVQPETNWDIIDLFRAFVELHELNSKNLFPEAVAEAMYWLAVAAHKTRETYEICQESWTEVKCLEEIADLSECHEEVWWQDTRELALSGLRMLQEGEEWEWEEWL